jgi:AcrR family transcriptional regulator
MITLRNVMDPKERQRQLLDIAQRLFLKQGYEKTSVSEIVRTAGLSQGAFYYYFESKMELLSELVDHILGEELQKTLDELVDRDDMDAIEKIMHLNSYLTDRAHRSMEFVDFLHDEKNANLHLMIEQKMFPLVVPPLTRLIEQGVAEGFFKTRYPRKTVVALLGAAEALNKISSESEEWEEVIEFAFDLAERILGAKPGTFSSRL